MFFFVSPVFFLGWERSAHDFLLNRYQKMGDSERRCPGIFGIFEIIMHSLCVSVGEGCMNDNECNELELVNFFCLPYALAVA